jgi:hypothetical protein
MENFSDPLEAPFVSRAPEILQKLSPEFRWEVTRRHPYYAMYWETARAHRTAPSDDPTECAQGQAAVDLLLLIGLTGEPVDPSLPFSSLSADPLATAWRNGAVALPTFRTLLGCLLMLPAQLRQEFGTLLRDSAQYADDDVEAKYELIRTLVQHAAPELDLQASAPLLSINIEASERAILEAVRDYVQAEKNRRGIKETRRREDRLPEYLAVWDQREGWSNGRYDVGRAKLLREITSTSSTSIETIRNQYTAAFRLIVGHEYRPELWDKLFVPLKLSSVFGGSLPAWKAISRPRRSRSPRPVTVSQLGTGYMDSTSAATRLADTHSGFIDLCHDICELIQAKATNDEIIRRLDLKDDRASEAIDVIRNRPQGEALLS